MLGKYWSSVAEAGATLAQHLAFAQSFPRSSSAVCVPLVSDTYSSRYNHILLLLLQ